MTYKQAAEQGWQVRGGEKGTHIEFWEMKERSNEKEAGPSQDGGESSAKENGFYNRRTDSIHLPPKDAFKDAPGYYGTALHELAHWTGHPSRLNRSTLSESYRFGDLNYAKEELRAELASVFMAAELGVPHDPANHAAYVGSWIKALREDKNEIFRAAHEASAATDFVLSLDREVRRTAALEPADLIRSESPPDRRLPVDALVAARSAHEANGNTREAAATQDLATSFAAAKRITADVLGEAARTFGAQTQSGRYNGRIIGETAQHVVQRLSPQTAVAHVKHLLEHIPAVGDNIAITYSSNHAQMRDIRERTNTQELAR